jgi:integrase
MREHVARTINRLSAKTIAAIHSPGRHADGGNLYLSVSSNGGRRWVFLFRSKGKLFEMGLGSARIGHVTLKEARERADAARRHLRDGVNPIDARRSSPAEVPSFGAFADELLDSLTTGFSNEKHIAQWKMTLETYAAPIRSKAVNAVDTADILGVLKPLWTNRPETASRLRGRIEKVLSAAKAKGLREGDNPARWRGHLDQMLPPRRRLTRGHHAALPFIDVPRFMARLRSRSAPTARALEFLILTATRSIETRGARRGEFDLEQQVWTIPASRMKAKREHRVPLTPAMIDLVEAAGKLEPNDLLFPSTKKDRALSDSAFKVLMLRLGHAKITAHGFRSAFRDWCSERTEYPHEVAEMALAHVIANRTEAAYRRGDLFEKRRALMQAWENYCDGLAHQNPQ